MLTGVTGCNTWYIVQWGRLLDAMEMRSGSVVMLWMIVIGVGVDVQRRHDRGRRQKRPNEHQRQHAAHELSLCNPKSGVKRRNSMFREERPDVLVAGYVGDYGRYFAVRSRNRRIPIASVNMSRSWKSHTPARSSS